MLRKLFVNALALFAVLAVAGGAMAAVDLVTDDDAEVSVTQNSGDGAEDRDDNAAGAKQRKAGDKADQADDQDDDASLGQGAEDADAAEDSFGDARSAEVAAYHECRDSAADDTAAEACEKPGPAWQNEAHPVFGADGREHPQADQDKQDHRAEASAQRPERAADAGEDEDDRGASAAGHGKSDAAHGKGKSGR